VRKKNTCRDEEYRKAPAVKRSPTGAILRARLDAVERAGIQAAEVGIERFQLNEPTNKRVKFLHLLSRHGVWDKRQTRTSEYEGKRPPGAAVKEYRPQQGRTVRSAHKNQNLLKGPAKKSKPEPE
jgi:hypothetical protein